MSELKLLPCPFCGGEAEIISRPVYTYLKPYDPETADKKHYVQCKGCATQCGALEYDTPEEAAAAWNRRSDAVPVVRGEWVYEINEYFRTCSVCRISQALLAGENLSRFKYCPFCGAKMESEGGT